MRTAESIWKGIEGVVIDAVGTLIDPRPSVAEVYAAVARSQGVDLDLDDVRTRFAHQFRNDEAHDQGGPLTTSEPLERARWQRIVGAVLPELPDPERGFLELWRHFGRPDAWSCHEDVAPALELLHARGLTLRVGSNFDARLRRVLAGLPDLARLADDPLISSEIGYRKPHPRFYQAACDQLGLSPDRLLCVGDDLENDVLGPRRAGLRGVLIDRKRRCPVNVPRVSGFAELVAGPGHE